MSKWVSRRYSWRVLLREIRTSVSSWRQMFSAHFHSVRRAMSGTMSLATTGPLRSIAQNAQWPISLSTITPLNYASKPGVDWISH